MKLFAPDYYKDFSCIADKCTHSCCIGWEIDIDDETLRYYKSVQGDFGKRLKESISEEGCPHFTLSENERCPFLDKSNLCDIITELGEDKLCQICADHPRYRNFFDDRIEIGLGLCCEEAGRIILTHQPKTELIELENNGVDEPLCPEEQAFFVLRLQLFEIIQDRRFTIDERIEKIISEYRIHIPQKSISEWAEFYLSLEQLDPVWAKKLNRLKKSDGFFKNPSYNKKNEIAFEQLAVYFLLRHLADGIYDGSLYSRIAFAILSLYMIREIYLSENNDSISDLIEIARLYSSEIEYSDENIEKLILVLNNTSSVTALP